MRVVAGDYGGRPLKALDGKTTRPTTDKVKGAIFNMIGPYFNGGRALDLFAGSGGLSIEAVSRGMDEAVLVEKDFRAQKIVMENIKMTKEDSKFTLLKMPAEKAMNSLAAQGQKFDLVLLDPPYAKEEIENNIQFLQDKDMLSDDAIIVCETDKSVDLSNEIGSFELIKQKVYGISKISIYEKVLDQVEEENNEDMEQVND
ncbi:16S rRNA (guanine(966)-N(2))-methyltransferase RsmD [Floricoccus penangensis]|uniref:16S rRNA (Guanine(966)-N(2))-methyltransferase RsmD n=1 Tax=Floricoccus penangensis TaxID=1859475 RepID=A0A9Q5JIG0_9LACT|nr:16S rRNA (guanine(966)-N(2))-methyltransferase RsmD [Floricoccus penangensis]